MNKYFWYWASADLIFVMSNDDKKIIHGLPYPWAAFSEEEAMGTVFGHMPSRELILRQMKRRNVVCLGKI
jgi:hypothetical protein